jgi:hypothetical protein
MFTRYRQMYRCENVPVERIAVFTEKPHDPLLEALYRMVPAHNKYHGVTNVNVNIVRRRARELSQDRHKFQPMHMVRDKKGATLLLNGRHTAVALVLLGAESLPPVEYPSDDEQERSEWSFQQTKPARWAATNAYSTLCGRSPVGN